MYTCDICGYQSGRHFNYLRHKKNKHGMEEEEDTSVHSESENSSDVSETSQESDDSDGSETFSESQQSENSSEETDEDEMSPWDVIINKTFQIYKPEYVQKVDDLKESGYNDEEAHKVAYRHMFKSYRDQIGQHYLGQMLWYNDMRRDPVHKKIKSTAKRLREEEEYETSEAWKYAVKKRKFLLDNVLNAYYPPSTEDSDDSME